MRFRVQSSNSIILVLFLSVSSLLATYIGFDEERVFKEFQLPEFVASYSFYIYSSFISIFILLGLLKLGSTMRVRREYLLLIFAYFILFSWSIFTATEQIRYLLIFLSICFVPYGIIKVMEGADRKFLAKISLVIFGLFLFLSALFSLMNYPPHLRISGMHSNPNLMGAWLISFLSVVLTNYRYYKASVLLACVVSVGLLVLLTGSRTSFAMLIIVISPLFLYRETRRYMLLLLVVGVLLSIVGLLEMDFRSIKFISAATDSGRAAFWSDVLTCIKAEPIFGYGMNGAQECIGIGSVFNSYLRVVLMLGMPLSILFFSAFLYFVGCLILGNSNVFIKSYFLSILVAFMAEDFVTGFGTPFFPFMLYMLSVYLYEKRDEILPKGGRNAHINLCR